MQKYPVSPKKALSSILICGGFSESISSKHCVMLAYYLGERRKPR